MASWAPDCDDAKSAELGDGVRRRQAAPGDADANHAANANYDADASHFPDAHHVVEADRVTDANHFADADQFAEADHVADADDINDANHVTDADPFADTHHVADADLADVSHVTDANLADANYFVDADQFADVDQFADAGHINDANHGANVDLAAVPASDVEAQKAIADHDGVVKDSALENDEGDHQSELNAAVNFYAAKKTVAQGMMDIALITSNANQMRYLLEFGSPNVIYYFNLTLVVISLILQIAVGTALIFKGRADLHAEPPGDASARVGAKRLDDAIVVGVFLITIINVFMAAFAIGSSAAS